MGLLAQSPQVRVKNCLARLNMHKGRDYIRYSLWLKRLRDGRKRLNLPLEVVCLEKKHRNDHTCIIINIAQKNNYKTINHVYL